MSIFHGIFTKHDYPYAWKEEQTYQRIDAPNVVYKRYYKECSSCGKRIYYNGPWEWAK